VGTLGGKVGGGCLSSSGARVPGWDGPGLGILSRGCFLGAIRDLEYLLTEALARRGGPGTWGILSRAEGPSQPQLRVCPGGRARGKKREGRIEAT